MTILFFLIWVALPHIHPAPPPTITPTCGCQGQPSDISLTEKRRLIRKEFDAASAVFSGLVVELDAFEVKFKVIKTWKGPSEDEITLLTGAKKVGERVFSSSCDYRFWKDKKYLVYAFGHPKVLKTNACSRTGEIKYRAEDVEELDKVKPPELKK